MKKNNSIYLKHILDSIDKIETYTANLEESDFYNNTLIQDGVVRQLESKQYFKAFVFVPKSNN